MASSPASRFVVPTKRIHTERELERFLHSETFRLLWRYVEELNESVAGRPVSSVAPQERSPSASSSPAATRRPPSSRCVNGVCALLDRLGAWIDEVPAHEGQRGRFGNTAFRTWFDKLAEHVLALVRDLLGDAGGDEDACVELAPYLCDAFGNRQRIDYGTGHEASFLAFLYCLRALHLFGKHDAPDVALRVLPKYLEVARRLQSTYMLEPAGSHGVWGLDDFAFLPFLLGSSQLREQQHRDNDGDGESVAVAPSAVLDADTVERLGDEYLYFGAVRFIMHTKKGPFSEHSPILYDISAVRSWSKVNKGMLKMYRAEVWSKRPVIQHFLFGRIIAYPEEGEEEKQQQQLAQQGNGRDGERTTDDSSCGSST